MALAAIEAGKHVYCEKPLAVSVEEAEEMATAAARKGVKTMVAFNNIKTPAAMLAKQLIEAGEIGEPIRFRGWFDQGFFNDPELPWSWRCSRKEAGSGALGDLGSHVVSVAQYLMGADHARHRAGSDAVPAPSRAAVRLRLRRAHRRHQRRVARGRERGPDAEPGAVRERARAA